MLRHLLLFYLIIAMSLQNFCVNNLGAHQQDESSWDLSSFHLKLSVIWKKGFWRDGLIAGTNSLDFPFLVDPDGDGMYDIYKFCGYSFYGYTSDGEQILNMTFESGLIDGTPQFGDFDGDGSEELVFRHICGPLVYMDPFSHEVKRSFLGPTNSRSLIYADFYGDGDKEFAIGGFHELYILDSEALEIRDIVADINATSIAPIDINNDDAYEIAFYWNTFVGVVDPISHEFVWSYWIPERFGSWFSGEMYVGDFDDDDVPEVVVVTWDCRVLVFDGCDGDIEANIAFDVPQDFFSTPFVSAAFCDLDGDGHIEGIFSWDFDSITPLKGIIAIVNMNDYSIKDIISITLEEPDWVCCPDPFSLVVADFNLDGYYDIMEFIVADMPGDKRRLSPSYVTIFDGKTLQQALSFDISTILQVSYNNYWYSSIDNRVVLFDVNNDGFFELVWSTDASLMLLRLDLDPYVYPLAYWVTWGGYYDSFRNFEFFDNDHDGLADYYEAKLGLDPTSRDTDNDGIPDRQEVLEYLRNLSLEVRENISGEEIPLWEYLLPIIVVSLGVSIAILIVVVKKGGRKNPFSRLASNI